jgi:threonine dehydrogenase-like Zn-dependent dehydrogenase
VRFTTRDIVCFKNVEVDEAAEEEEEGEDEETVEAVLGPVTIWIGVFLESTTATAAHHAAQGILALLQKYQITDVNVDFRESVYTHAIGPQLLKPIDDLGDGHALLAVKFSIDREQMASPQPHLRRILVIGGGPSGLVALRNLTERGHFDRVELVERRDNVGGVWWVLYTLFVN